MQLSHFHLGACHRQKKEQRRFSFHRHTYLGACHRKNVKNIQLAAVTFSPGSLPAKKGKEGSFLTATLIWEPATAKNVKHISSLQLSHFRLGACHRKRKVKKVQLGACHRKKIKNIQLAAVTFSLGSLPPQKKGQEISVCNCHAHLGACHPKKGTNVQLASVAFSSGSLPPPKRQEYPVCSCHIFAWGPATAKKKVKKVSFQLSTTTVIWESATTKNEQMCSLQVYHLGACHQKNVKSRLQNRRWDRLELFFTQRKIDI